MGKSWAREVAVKVLYKVLREGAYANIALKKALEASDLSRVDKALVTEIVNGTLRNHIRIDWTLSQFVKQKNMDPWMEDILRAGIYQMLFLDRVPDSAVCNESTELAKRHGHEAQARFVNGVLRNISRNKETLPLPDKNKNPEDYLAVMYSHPSWMVRKWLKDYDMAFTEALLKANNEIPPFSIRINRLKTDKESLRDKLLEEGIAIEEADYIKDAFHLKGTSAIEEKASFKQGFYQVQDESSMLVAMVMDPKPGEVVMDLCSAPGGKSTHMAELMKNQGRIIARDIHPQKLKLVQDNCRRLGITIVETEVFDAEKSDDRYRGKVDRVLVDAPCSGLGVLRRKPDMRWKKTPQDFGVLSDMQKKILAAASKYVKKKGVLVYSTCTINKDENLAVIQRFLEQNPEFVLEDISGFIPEGLDSDTSSKGYIELYPNVHRTDGFFIARMRRA